MSSEEWRSRPLCSRFCGRECPGDTDTHLSTDRPQLSDLTIAVLCCPSLSDACRTRRPRTSSGGQVLLLFGRTSGPGVNVVSSNGGLVGAVRFPWVGEGIGLPRQVVLSLGVNVDGGLLVYSCFPLPSERCVVPRTHSVSCCRQSRTEPAACARFMYITSPCECDAVCVTN